MARPATSTRPKVEDFLSLDIHLAHGILTSRGSSGNISWSRPSGVASVGYVRQEGGLRLRYVHTGHDGAQHRIDEVIPIVRTPTPFGGQRHWFACPGCSRRCRLIYGGSHFRCRHCHNARYASQYEGLALRISRRRWRIRRKLERLAGKPWPFGLDDASHRSHGTCAGRSITGLKPLIGASPPCGTFKLPSGSSELTQFGPMARCSRAARCASTRPSSSRSAQKA